MATPVTRGIVSKLPSRATLLKQVAKPEEKKEELTVFDIRSIYTIKDNDPAKEYARREKTEKIAVHWGQLKLLMTEIDFLCRYWDPKEVPNPVVLYIGGASGEHVNVLSKMFPQFLYELYDGRPFDESLQNNPKVILHQTLFDDIEMKKWADRQSRDRNVFLISDIRSLGYKSVKKMTVAEEKENERLIQSDMDLQQKWVQQINPVRAHLKFRLPYTYPWTIEEGYPLTRTYLDGDLYRQAWAPQTSTECRLVPDKDLKMKEWKTKQIEDQLFYHNTQLRENTNFENPLSQDPLEQKRLNEWGIQIGLTNDYDSTLTLLIIKGYLEKFNLKNITPNQVYTLCDFIFNNIKPQKASLYIKRSQKRQIEEDE